MYVELRHISKRFGTVQANDDISLCVQAGSIHGLLGENGAGKSTLVKVLSGFIRRDRGEILLDSKPVEVRSPAEAIRVGVGMLHQDPLDFPPLTVLENFLIGRPSGIFLNRRAAVRQFQQLAIQFNFHLDPDARVHTLTVGERQQLEILRLLSLGVRTLILDEPTTGISASQKTALFQSIHQLATTGRSIIFVSHKLEDVAALCHRVTILRQGRVVGNIEAPFVADRLVELMFEKVLPPPTKPPTRQNHPLLHAQNLHLNTDRLSVTLNSLSVQAGEVIGLAGLEGNGQQLLLQCCAGLLQATSGSLHLYPPNGKPLDLTHLPYQQFLQAGIGYVPADRLRDGLIPGLSIQDHIALRTTSTSPLIPWATIQREAVQAIHLFNIRGKPDSLVERLSGGNQQRTQLALMPVPLNLLLMEHPTRGLDIESTAWVWQQLISRCQTGTAILFMSSDLDEIMQYSDRILVFSGGRVSPPISTTDLTIDALGHAIGGNF
jgi:simple sugar transport system ATP-binding protein